MMDKYSFTFIRFCPAHTMKISDVCVWGGGTFNFAMRDTNLRAPSLQARARRQPSVFSSTTTADMYLENTQQ